ncbi:SDR family NAD(P)-dependent oxidoreductase [Streptomyces sp. NPDC059766]|uniref:SDR family NAD(P)-dependent oxidoreductase n=1 Tax=Streptomyces sp. NPDC059766 TaxID=3346940 RepID=UPI003657F743
MTERVALVTGAAGTIGSATVECLLRAGHAVVLVDRDEEAMAKVVENMRHLGRVLAVPQDLSVRSAGADIAAAITAAGWMLPTILVNNAGLTIRHEGQRFDLTNIPLEEWDLMYAVNLEAPMLLARAFLPHMIETGWGRIVNVSSRCGRYNPYQAGPAYSSSKTAVLGLTRSIATDYGRDGITCNAIAPGYITSQMSGSISAEGLEGLLERTAIGRPGTGMEVGAAIAFLASEEAAFITGACLDVNGGQSMA